MRLGEYINQPKLAGGVISAREVQNPSALIYAGDHRSGASMGVVRIRHNMNVVAGRVLASIFISIMLVMTGCAGLKEMASNPIFVKGVSQITTYQTAQATHMNKRDAERTAVYAGKISKILKAGVPPDFGKARTLIREELNATPRIILLSVLDIAEEQVGPYLEQENPEIEKVRNIITAVLDGTKEGLENHIGG